jgi:WhiB family transcriptional regulator, redox-sensing transcriptional regulator
VRLTTLLDSLNGATPGSSRIWSGLDSVEADQFDQLVATLIPCREHDAELWFAEMTAEVELAKALCQECPIRQGCLEGAIARQEPWGVWGGEVFIGGVVVPRKRGRGRPRKEESTAA